MTVNLIEFYNRFPTEEACIKYLEAKRWNGKITCPRCNCETVYKFKDGRLYKCKDCRKKFTVKICTIFEDSPLPLQKWFFAVYLLTSLKKGISSVQLGKYIGVTQKTGWFILHRVRYSTTHKTLLKPLSGIIESDETYNGGVRRGTRGRGAKNKVAIFGMKQRGGDVRMQVVDDVKKSTLMPIIKENVAEGSTMMTDEFLSYNSLNREGYNHLTVTHGTKEFVKGIAHTNNIENTWSHFKRGVKAIQIHISRKHTNKYLEEYAFRLNTRKINDFERFSLWFDNCEEKRLTYQTLIA